MYTYIAFYISFYTIKEIEAIKQDEVNNNPLSNMNFDYGKEYGEGEE